MDIMEEWIKRASRDKNYGDREDALMTLTTCEHSNLATGPPIAWACLLRAALSVCVWGYELWTLSRITQGRKSIILGYSSATLASTRPFYARFFPFFFFFLSFFLFLISYSLSYSFGCNSFICGGFWGERRAILHSLLLETLLLFPPQLFFYFVFVFLFHFLYFFLFLPKSLLWRLAFSLMSHSLTSHASFH